MNWPLRYNLSQHRALHSQQGEESNKELQIPAQQCVRWALDIFNCGFIPYLQHKAKVFIAEQIASYMSAWTDITFDKTALKIVEGDEIEFEKEAFAHNSNPHNSFSTEQVSLLEQELH